MMKVDLTPTALRYQSQISCSSVSLSKILDLLIITTYVDLSKKRKAFLLFMPTMVLPVINPQYQQLNQLVKDQDQFS